MSVNLSARPRWVRMMDNPTTNYFKAVKSYNRYWRKHFLPGEEKEDLHREVQEEDPRPLIRKWFQSEEQAKEKSNSLKVEYKKFKKWEYEMLPFVKANGRLMDIDERLAAWKQSQSL